MIKVETVDNYGAIFKNIREKRGLSLTQVARGIISPATLSRWENGKGEMYFGNVVSLLQRLNIYLDESISIPQYSRKDNAAKTNPCHIADYYESKKLSSQTKGSKR